jgi:hypothetical protein
MSKFAFLISFLASDENREHLWFILELVDEHHPGNSYLVIRSL